MKQLGIIAVLMVAEGAHVGTILKALEQARTSEAYRDLFMLWLEAPDDAAKAAIIGSLEECLQDLEAPLEDYARTLEERQRHKAHLRGLVARHGGVTKVAKKANMSQPSLSRILNGVAEPRLTTMYRLADAMDVAFDALYPDNDDE